MSHIENNKTTVCDKSELFLSKRLTRELSSGFTIVYYSVIYCKNAESVNKPGEIAKGSFLLSITLATTWTESTCSAIIATDD